MLNYLKLVDDEFDALFFLPMEDMDEDGINIISKKYKDPGKEIDGSEMGKWWHILLFRCNKEEGLVENLDTFDAIFSDPKEYISSLIPQGWYGVIAKKTTTSNEFINDALDRFREMM